MMNMRDRKLGVDGNVIERTGDCCDISGIGPMLRASVVSAFRDIVHGVENKKDFR